MEMTHVSLAVLIVLRDALRSLPEWRLDEFSPDEQDALLHANAKIEAGPEHCSSWPK